MSALTSRVELILKKWLGESVNLEKPRSRIEALLISLMGDTYTKEEIDELISDLVQGLDWKEAVATYTDLARVYPNAEAGWTASTLDNNEIYRYNGTQWVNIAAWISDYYTKTESDARYQQKEVGKGLSTNDFTLGEKAKLDSLGVNRLKITNTEQTINGVTFAPNSPVVGAVTIKGTASNYCEYKLNYTTSSNMPQIPFDVLERCTLQIAEEASDVSLGVMINVSEEGPFPPIPVAYNVSTKTTGIQILGSWSSYGAALNVESGTVIDTVVYPMFTTDEEAENVWAEFQKDLLIEKTKTMFWTDTQEAYEALTPEEKVYQFYNIIENDDEEEPANTASLQSLSPLTLDRNTLNLENDYPEEVSENADTDI